MHFETSASRPPQLQLSFLHSSLPLQPPVVPVEPELLVLPEEPEEPDDDPEEEPEEPDDEVEEEEDEDVSSLDEHAINAEAVRANAIVTFLSSAEVIPACYANRA